MALFQLLLEQFVAGPGAGQEQPKALEAETRGSEDSFAHGAPKEEGSRGVWAWTQAGIPPPSMPPPSWWGGKNSVRRACPVSPPRQRAELCLGTQERGVWLPSGSSPDCTFLCTGTKLRNSSTWPTESQSEYSSTGACTCWAFRKSRTTLAIRLPPDLGGERERASVTYGDVWA